MIIIKEMIKSNRLQEEDGGFFEKLGSRLVEKVQIQEQEESLTAASADEEVSSCEQQHGVNQSDVGHSEVETMVCKAELREALYAEKENVLKRSLSHVADPTTPVTDIDDPEPRDRDEEEEEEEEVKNTLDVLAESIGLNVSYTFLPFLFFRLLYRWL